eukprot:1312882-Pyramimonas_sp.AAC.1
MSGVQPPVGELGVDFVDAAEGTCQRSRCWLSAPSGPWGRGAGSTAHGLSQETAECVLGLVGSTGC